MCSCQHKVHWSVVSIIVNVVAIVLYTTAVATPHWAQKSGALPVNTGLFQACSEVNGTCYDTDMYFDAHSEKGNIIASAILCIFGLVGMILFFTLSVFFLCGLYGEAQLATGAVIAAYVSAVFAMVGTVVFGATITSLDYTLSWSFVLAVLGFIVDIAAGVLMCIGRNMSADTRKTKKRRKSDDLVHREELEMRRRFEEKHLPKRRETTEAKQPWSTNDGYEATTNDVWTSGDGPTAEKKPWEAEADA